MPAAVMEDITKAFVGSDAVGSVYAGSDLVTVLNPKNIAAWTHGWWADDPDWTNPGDGNNVTSWANFANASYPLSGDASTPPSFVASYAGLGGKGAILTAAGSEHFDALDIPNLSQPTTIVRVMDFTIPSGSLPDFFDGATNRHLVDLISGPTWRIFAGSTVSGGSAVAAPTLLVATFNGASSSLTVNGTTALSGNAGTSAWDQILFDTGANGNSLTEVHDGFVGIKNGLLTAAELARVKKFASDYYGLTVA